MSYQLNCLRCSGMMEQGILPDKTKNKLTNVSWVSGESEHSIWDGIKLKGKSKKNVYAYRCSDCGYLELYAQRDDK